MIEGIEEEYINLFAHPMDFRIYWNSASYLGTTLIPQGEINFSQMERDIPEVAMLMTYVRTILNMVLTFNILKAIWNLLMEFLGVREAVEEYDETGADVIYAEAPPETKMLGG